MVQGNPNISRRGPRQQKKPRVFLESDFSGGLQMEHCLEAQKDATSYGTQRQVARMGSEDNEGAHGEWGQQHLGYLSAGFTFKYYKFSTSRGLESYTFSTIYMTWAF